METVLKIQGGHKLSGKIKISGAKNAALPIMCATLLTDQELKLDNIPKLSDVKTMAQVLNTIGTEIEFDGNSLNLKTRDIKNHIAPYDLVKTMRASIIVLGPLLARHKFAQVSLPGGCSLGARAVDLHLEGLKALGAEIELNEGYIKASAQNGLTGTTFTLRTPSVGATENLMMAASIAKGISIFRNAAREPEITDLANCLIKMGAQIEGAGTDTLTITGVDSLKGCEHKVISDRIEAGTYAIMAAACKSEIDILNTDLNLLPAFKEAMQSSGVTFEPIEDGFRVLACDKLVGVDISTEPYPGYPTDLQAQFMALMCFADGASLISENIFENRFMHVPELCRMGANIQIHERSALVRGVDHLSPAQVMATDLRASVSLIIAALATKGETTLQRLYHLDRGYEDLELKLSSIGAVLERVKL